MSAPSGVRGPSNTTVWPSASKMWNDRFPGFAPLTLHVWLPVFVIVTATVFDSSQYASIVAGSAYDAAKRAVSTTAAERNGALPKFVPNQPTPSRTRSTVSVYAPPATGVVTFAFTCALAFGATSAGSAVRAPAPTTGVPAMSGQWYAESMGFAPVAFQ